MPSEWCKADSSIERIRMDGVAFPLGVYPVETLTPRTGYTLVFEQADGTENSEWEEWPDRYLFDIVVSSERLPTLFRTLSTLLPPRLYPILDVLGHDAYREIDPYITEHLLGLDAFLESINRFADFFFEDGLCGFGAMCDDPFIYLFVDEHKIVTVRCEPELKPKIEKAMEAFDLVERPDAAGADHAAHEHRGVLVSPESDPMLLSGEEIVETLQDEWRLMLNVDTERNLDDRGRELGVTPWRCFVRIDQDPDGGIDPDDEDAAKARNRPQKPPPSNYAEVWLTAGSYRQAIELASDAAIALCEQIPIMEPLVIAADRMESGAFLKDLGERSNSARRRDLGRPRIWEAHLVPTEPAP